MNKFILFLLTTICIIIACTSKKPVNSKPVAVSTHNETSSSSPLPKAKITPSDLLGKLYRDATEIGATKDISGSLIGTSEYGIRRVKIDSSDILLLEKCITKEDPNKPKYFALDFLILPSLPESAEVVTIFCRRNGVSDSEIVALVHYEDTEWFKKIIKAWRANIKTEKFEEISPESIDCHNQSYGVD